MGLTPPDPKMKRVRITVPASSANLGPGFDVLGLALTLENVFELEEAEGVSVDVAGEGALTLPRDKENVVVRGAAAVYAAVGRQLTGLRVRQTNAIPPGRGLGSSATAWLGGMLGANALCKGALPPEVILEMAVREEGHPDNLAAALYGGLTIACLDNGHVRVLKLPLASNLRFAVLIPDLEAETVTARAVLPSHLSREDGVFNLARACILVGALTLGRPDLLRSAMADRWHQPYRLALFPWLAAVFQAAQEAGALGWALSGAGPSVLAITGEDAEKVGAAMLGALERSGITGRARVLGAAELGSRVEILS